MLGVSVHTRVLTDRCVCTVRPGEQAGALSGIHLEAAQAPQPTPISNSLYIILICLWGPGSKVMRLLLLFFWLETPAAII